MAVLLIAWFAMACAGAGPPAPDVTPAPPAPIVAAPAAEASDQPLATTITEFQPCVMRDFNLPSTNGVYAVVPVDTMYRGKRIAEAFPAPGQYAADAPWFINGEAITIGELRYVKSGQPSVLGANSVMRWRGEEKRGVAIFIDAGHWGTRHPPQVVYVPVRPGCEFQSYNRAA